MESEKYLKTPTYTRRAIDKYYNKMKEEDNGERYKIRLQYLRDRYHSKKQLVKQQYREKHPSNEIIIKTIRHLFIE